MYVTFNIILDEEWSSDGKSNKSNESGKIFYWKKIMNYVMLYILYFKCTNYSK